MNVASTSRSVLPRSASHPPRLIGSQSPSTDRCRRIQRAVNGTHEAVDADETVVKTRRRPRRCRVGAGPAGRRSDTRAFCQFAEFAR